MDREVSSWDGRPSTQRKGRRLASLGFEGDGLPLFKRIKLEITRLLSAGRIQAGEALPTEKELSDRYGVSVGTIRRAIDELVAEHVVIRQQGRGTFVATFSPERMLNRFWGVVRKDGVREIPIVQPLRFADIKADARAAARLAVPPGAPLLEIVNLMLMGGNPVIVDHVLLPRALFQGLDREGFVSREGTMYWLYQSRFGINVIRAEDRLHGISADAETARMLGVARASPLLEIERVAYTFDDRPVESRRTLLLTNGYEYRNAIGGAPT